MLARKELPDAFAEWNASIGAPFGYFYSKAHLSKRLLTRCKNIMPFAARLHLFGPFSVQPNTTNRTFEYPWAISIRPVWKGMRVVEVGGGLSGFQFALSKMGCDVTNVDPGMEAAGRGWPCDAATIARINWAFGTNVTLRNTTVEKANLPSDSFDRAFSISVLEHMPDADIQNVMAELYRILKPGGELILTVDLFLDIAPFAPAPANLYGRNIDLDWLSRLAPFERSEGNPEELLGFPEFDRHQVLQMSDQLLQGDTYPVLVQCLILRKPQTEPASSWREFTARTRGRRNELRQMIAPAPRRQRVLDVHDATASISLQIGTCNVE